MVPSANPRNASAFSCGDHAPWTLDRARISRATSSARRRSGRTTAANGSSGSAASISAARRTAPRGSRGGPSLVPDSPEVGCEQLTFRDEVHRKQVRFDLEARQVVAVVRVAPCPRVCAATAHTSPSTTASRRAWPRRRHPLSSCTKYAASMSIAAASAEEPALVGQLLRRWVPGSPWRQPVGTVAPTR